MECTDWDSLYDDHATIDESVDVINSYITFCIDVVVPKKQIKCYPNNKPRVTKDLKILLNRKKAATATSDRTKLKDVQKDINRMLHVCKKKYKEKIENLFTSDSRTAWDGLRKLTGWSKKKITPDIRDVKAYCNELNQFYARFDKYDFCEERTSIVKFLKLKQDKPVVISVKDVLKSLQSLKVGKSSGPDKISGKILSLCKVQLAPILSKLF